MSRNKEKWNRYMRHYRQSPQVKSQIAEYMREYRKRDYVKAQKKSYKQRPEVKLRLKIKREYIENKIKSKTQNYTNRKIKNGELKRKPCKICGLKKTEAHHKNYKKPDVIEWLCHKHHSQKHQHSTVRRENEINRCKKVCRSHHL